MKTDPNINDYPRLVPPDVVYEGKDALKKKAMVIPLYVKVISAAAVVALLVGIFWRRPAMPEQVMIAELEPVKMGFVESEQPLLTSGNRAHFNMPSVKNNAKSVLTAPSVAKREVVERQELPLLAALTPCAATTLNQQKSLTDMVSFSEDPQLALEIPRDERWDELSLARKGLLAITDGQYDSFSKMLLNGWRSVKTEMTELNDSFSDGINKIAIFARNSQL